MTSKITKSKNEDANNGKTWFEILVILIVAFVSLSAGILMTWPSPFIVQIVNNKEKYDITEEEASYFTVFNTVGVILFPPLLTPIVNRFGRKKLILLTSVFYMITFIIKAFARSLWLFYFARFLNGFGDSITYTCVVVYIGEITTPKVRGVWGNAVVWFGFLGQFIINVLGIYFDVTTTSFICLTIPTFLLIVFPFMPESPYFHLSKGREEEAKTSLRKLRRKFNIEDEFMRMKTAIEKEETGSWGDLFKNKVNRRALGTAMFLRVSQIWCGIFTFGPYIQLIFQKSGSNLSPELCTIIYTFVNFLFYSSAAYGSNKLGRRVSLISSLVLTSIVFILEAIYFFIDDYYNIIDLTSLRWFPLVGLMVFLLFSCYGIGTIPFLMPGELFAPSIKAKGVALVICVFGLSNFIVNTLFYNLMTTAGLGAPFLFFGICSIISAIVFYKILPETKNKTLEEIQIILSKM
ncbi:facilitated trehalose transporter Tret1-like [Diorhabda carinulata]|uniref:facilitated trehalose transporter Tret1-like n=1 Tax=Diorhabda carinulata TaxID=1163345 RepID=UPI0025A2EDC0|nr:facilitated trehalose transporter Tret1-like [Diorhabda carinulata]